MVLTIQSQLLLFLSNQSTTQFNSWTNFSHGNEVPGSCDQRPISGCLKLPSFYFLGLYFLIYLDNGPLEPGYLGSNSLRLFVLPLKLKRLALTSCECKWKGRGLFKIWKHMLTLNYLGFFKSSWVTCTVHFQKSWHSLQDTLNSCFSFEKVGRQN